MGSPGLDEVPPAETFISASGRLVQKLASRRGGARKWWRGCRICIIFKEFPERW